ncbi:hypothetical protein [Chitinophaga parva]|uniref:hypothetical protein n=1 Tax=Chitinophaga parva TaxID=2169414 RepID=UPI00105720F8|nr:hypothetical protein [Chitinophaga parva]
MALFRRLQHNKQLAGPTGPRQKQRSETVDSYQKLERASGIPKATLIGVFQGKINAASTTLFAIAEALDGGMTALGSELDSITDEDLAAYKEALRHSQKARIEKKKKGTPGRGRKARPTK